MPIPDFQTIMLPLLQIASDGETHNIHDVTDNLAGKFNLSDEEKSQMPLVVFNQHSSIGLGGQEHI